MAGFRRVAPYVPLTAAGWRVRGGGRFVLAGVVGLYGAGGGGYGTPVGEAVVRPAPCMASGRCRRISSAGLDVRVAGCRG